MKLRRIIITVFILSILFLILNDSKAYEYSWQLDETPEGQESATIVEPIKVNILDEQIEIASHNASIWLLKRYSVHLTSEWHGAYASRLLQAFESIPQRKNSLRFPNQVPASIWKISNNHIHNDIEIEYNGDIQVVTIASDAFTHANPFLDEIEGVRGKYFSKRLHRSIVRFVSDNGNDQSAIKKILRKRYNLSIDIPDYEELTRYTTGEEASRFSEFKNEELIALTSMLEEYPSGMLKTPGLKYLVRRLDGTPHPLYPTAPAVAWTSAGYIEFMESAFQGQGLDYIHRLILHEKAHFLWAHLFDEQLKQDWIKLGGWYENPDDVDGWSTTKQTEFVSAYAHGKNPNEDMAESISFYIVNPDKLRSRAPAKYDFIQNRIMHGTRYISQIREDLTFEVYNLYPDYVYPGKIKRIDIKVEGEPDEDKIIKVEIEIHRESDLDSVKTAYIRVYSDKGTWFDIAWLQPYSPDGQRVASGHILRGQAKLSRHAIGGYWSPDTIRLQDANGNERNEGQTDFGWKLYIDNPLADCKPPEYVPDSMRLSLSTATTTEGKPYQIVTASWETIEESGIKHVFAVLNDNIRETYSIYRQTEYGGNDIESNRVVVKFSLPEYMPSGLYSLNRISMLDIALNASNVYFTDAKTDEPPKTIEVITKTPDLEPPVLDVNRITIKAEPTRPEAPNGETIVDISFWIKDNISGYEISSMRLRDPQGIMHHFYQYSNGYAALYFAGDTTIFKKYHKRIVLPVGSAPGTWGLAEMTIFDKAGNTERYDFTEIIRFKIEDDSMYTESDVNKDGQINILDLILVAQALGTQNSDADVNNDGTVSILDLVAVANEINEDVIAAPIYATQNQIETILSNISQADDGSIAFRTAIHVLQNLLRKIQPETTALLPNYPNPFNPETWIPYQLARSSDVSISIYAADGKLVRQLALGNQAAGIYQSRSRAVYWDGKNQIGESVSSGLYFYSLTAGEFSATRRMLIIK